MKVVTQSVVAEDAAALGAEEGMQTDVGSCKGFAALSTRTVAKVRGDGQTEPQSHGSNILVGREDRAVGRVDRPDPIMARRAVGEVLQPDQPLGVHHWQRVARSGTQRADLLPEPQGVDVSEDAVLKAGVRSGLRFARRVSDEVTGRRGAGRRSALRGWAVAEDGGHCVGPNVGASLSNVRPH
jgi:hypothetical protein